MSVHKCPYCGNKEKFVVSAHIIEDWVVDRHGEFIEVDKECVDVAHYPDDDDIWYCIECGEEAIVVEEEDDDDDD